MKYFLSSLAGLFAVLVLSTPAWADGGMKDKGWELVAGAFAEQFGQPQSVGSSTTLTTTDTAFHGGIGYDFGTLYVGGTYYNWNGSTTGGSTTQNRFVTWYGPSVGLILNNVRVVGTYVLSPDANNNNTGQVLTNGSGFAVSIAYSFYVSPKIFIAPMLDYSSVTYSQPSGTSNYTMTQLEPFLSLGINF